MGCTYQIVSIGRRWKIGKDEHILVMDARNRAYHLFLARDDAQWYWVNSDDNPAVTAV
jgi:hypothetical protein